jgi:predicted aldo/keto reductase-like oxidoreductase
MRRRTFLGGSVAALGAGAAPAASIKSGDIPTRTFGKTGEKLTIIGQAGGRFPLITFEEAKAITQRAYDLGINYFDTAALYWNGRSEEVYGAVLPPFRKKIFLTTKAAGRSRKEAEELLHASLRRLKTDYVDLWQMHQVSEMAEVDQIFAPGGAIEAFEAAKKAGKCRFIGFTGHHDPHVHLEMLKRYDKYDTILMPLNMADPSYLSFEKLVLPVAVERGLGIQAMKSTANAKLLQSFSAGDCLRYTLSLPAHCLAIGCTTLGQLEDDVRIAQQFSPLAPEQLASFRERAKRLAGPGLEDWKRETERAGGSGTPRHMDV